MSAAPEQKGSSFVEQGPLATDNNSAALSPLARYRGLAVQQRRLVHFALATLLLLMSSWLAFTQQSRPIISSTSSISGLSTLWQKVVFPMERSAFLRLPVLTSELKDVFTLPGSEHVWAVGDGGLILYSPDAGGCWQQQHPVPGAPCGERTGGSWSLVTAARAAEAPRQSIESEKIQVPEGQGVASELRVNNIGVVDNATKVNNAVQLGTPTDLSSEMINRSSTNKVGVPVGKDSVDVYVEQAKQSIDRLPVVEALQPRLLLNAKLKAVFFIDAQQGWAVGDRGLVLSTVDGGQSWQAQTVGESVSLSDVVFNKAARQGWVIGTGGQIFTSLDTGETWQAQNSGTKKVLMALSLVDKAGRLCVVGQGGLVLISSNGGQRWQVQNSGTSNNLIGVSFTDDLRGWAVGSLGTIVTTSDGGIRWQAQNSRTKERLRGVDFRAGAEFGWVVGDKGTVLTTVDGGLNWVVRQSINWAALIAVSFSDARKGWAVGRDGSILFSADGGQIWQLQMSGYSPWFESLAFDRDKQQEQRASTKGASRGANDELSWRVDDSDTFAGLERLSFNRDVQRAWAVEPDGAILITTDAGATWRSPTQLYSRWPAPWYYGAVLLSLLIAAAPIKAVVISPKNGLRIEERGQSDRPVETQLEDKLDFWPVSQALSKFLRNRQTQPPLTVAITGAWGSGKSSLMNLLKVDLARSGVQAVWFNAWHHESEEEYLLPALLQNIRQQAIPPLLSFNGGRFYGLRFRARLLWQRLKARPLFLALVILGFIIVNTGFVFDEDRFAFGSEQLTLARAAFCEESKLPKFICPEESRKKEGEASEYSKSLAAKTDTAEPDSINWLTPLINMLLGTGSGAVLLNWLRAFGISPARLAKEMGSGGERQMEQRMGYRHNFQQEFRTVTDALNPRTMLILIDDLDRCQPKTVVQILEAVNFLTSAGRCYVVLGMAREMVEPAVGLAFKEIADEITHHRSGEAEDGEQQKNGYAQRREFARKYLEKLINLEIPVPTIEAAQALRLLGDNTSNKPEAGKWWSSSMTAIFARGLFFFALVLATLWFGNVLAPQSPLGVEPTRQASGVGLKSGDVAVNVGADKTGSAGRDETSLSDGTIDKPAVFIPGALAPVLPWLPVLAAVLIFGFGSYSVMRKLRQAESEDTAAVVDDSEPFSRALKVWNPVIASQLETPRELRRFMNRIRYTAVRINGMTADSGFENTLSEEEIVSLAALYLLDPACIELTAEVDGADQFLKSFNINELKKQRGGGGSSSLTDTQIRALGEAIHNYTAEDGIATWDFDDNKIHIFNVLLQGIKVH